MQIQIQRKKPTTIIMKLKWFPFSRSQNGKNLVIIFVLRAMAKWIISMPNQNLHLKMYHDDAAFAQNHHRFKQPTVLIAIWKFANTVVYHACSAMHHSAWAVFNCCEFHSLSITLIFLMFCIKPFIFILVDAVTIPLTWILAANAANKFTIFNSKISNT